MKKVAKKNKFLEWLDKILNIQNYQSIGDLGDLEDVPFYEGDENIKPVSKKVTKAEIEKVNQPIEEVVFENDKISGDITDPTGLIPELTKRINQIKKRLKKKCKQLITYIEETEETLSSAQDEKYKSDVKKLRLIAIDNLIVIEDFLALDDDKLVQAGIYLAVRREIRKQQKVLGEKYKVVDKRLKENPTTYQFIKNLKGNCGVPQKEIDKVIDEINID